MVQCQIGASIEAVWAFFQDPVRNLPAISPQIASVEADPAQLPRAKERC